jgi:Flp pilus assembly protein TadD
VGYEFFNQCTRAGARAAVPGLSLQQAQALHRDGQLQAARTLCERQLRDTPGDFDALSLLGLIAAQHGDFTSAVAAYDQVLALAPGSADSFARIGISNARPVQGCPPTACA